MTKDVKTTNYFANQIVNSDAAFDNSTTIYFAQKLKTNTININAMINEINTIEDVKLFANQLVNEESLGFHPDNDFADYINLITQQPIYSTEKVSQLNKMMNKCFIICEQGELDVYELMGEPLFQKMKVGEYSEN